MHIIADTVLGTEKNLIRAYKFVMISARRNPDIRQDESHVPVGETKA